MTRTLAFDLDGTIADWLGGMKQAANFVGEIRINPFEQAPPVYEPIGYGWFETRDQLLRHLSVWEDYFVLATPLIDPITPRVIRELFDMGFEVDIVTARHPKVEGPTRDWLKHYSIPYNELKMGVHDKTQGGYSVLIDDNPETLDACSNSINFTNSTQPLTIGRVQPYNRESHAHLWFSEIEELPGLIREHLHLLD